jgi:hypothetical protein
LVSHHSCVIRIHSPLPLSFPCRAAGGDERGAGQHLQTSSSSRRGRASWPSGLKFSGGNGGPKAGGSSDPTPKPAKEPSIRASGGAPPLPSLAARQRVWPPSLPRVCPPPFSSPLDPLFLTFSSLRLGATHDCRCVDADKLCTSSLSTADPSEFPAPAAVHLPLRPSQRGLRRERVEQGLRRRCEEHRPSIGGRWSVWTG